MAQALPVVTVTGPRQSGKTTLCQAAFPVHPCVNLEIPGDRQFALEDPRAFLARLPDGTVLDEIQRCPDLLSYIQGLVDRDPRPGRWILAGSQNLLLLECVSQSLASLASDAGVSQPTTRAWLSVLEASFIVMRLPAWHRILGKRLVYGGDDRQARSGWEIVPWSMLAAEGS